MKRVLFCTVSLAAALGLAQAQAPAPAPSPPVTISLGSREAQATPILQGFTHTGAGNIDVAQPSPDALVVTMTGVAVAGPHPCKASAASLQFDLEQCFDVAIDKPGLKEAKLTLEGRVIGLLRTHKRGGGSADMGPARAAVGVGHVEIIGLEMKQRGVSGGENLSINDRQGPLWVPVRAGQYTLRQTWAVTATHPRGLNLCKAASAEFAPDPALDPLWISYWEPFHGAAKKDFGFQVIIKVVPGE